jgi:hypothetical protein
LKFYLDKEKLIELGGGQIHVRQRQRRPMERPPGSENRTTTIDQKRLDSLRLLLGWGFTGNYIGYFHFEEDLKWQAKHPISPLIPSPNPIQ